MKYQEVTRLKGGFMGDTWFLHNIGERTNVINTGLG
jgi:hypothetical protein